MRKAQTLFYRSCFKVVEVCCRLYTWIHICKHRRRNSHQGEARAGAKKSDPSALLLDFMTESQMSAQGRDLQPQTFDGSLHVIIPFRDRWSMTKRCLDSLAVQNINNINGLITLVDNGSQEHETADAIKNMPRTLGPWKIRSLRLDVPFNYSYLNNSAVNEGPDSDLLLFLNNDVILPDPSSIEKLAKLASGSLSKSDAERKSTYRDESIRGDPPTAPVQGNASQHDVGAVGCTLKYADNRIQHLFVAPGVKIVAAHPLKGQVLEGNWRWFAQPRPVAAVTGAVLMVRSTLFAQVGGFDEGLPTIGQDVDLCLKLSSKGLVNWVLPDIHGIHLEGATRRNGIDTIDPAQVKRIYDRWGDYLVKNPYYSNKFSRWSETPALSIGEPCLYPWQKVLL